LEITCHLGAKGDKGTHKEVSLVFFSTFESLERTPASIMQQAGVPIPYDSASNQHRPALPLHFIQCFIGCNRHTSIPHGFKDDWRLGSAFPDTKRDRDTGSRLYEVKIWRWRYGRGRPASISAKQDLGGRNGMMATFFYLSDFSRLFPKT
jgi:hypothetical protein